jgi:hypothetical protein
MSTDSLDILLLLPLRGYPVWFSTNITLQSVEIRKYNSWYPTNDYYGLRIPFHRKQHSVLVPQAVEAHCA